MLIWSGTHRYLVFFYYINSLLLHRSISWYQSNFMPAAQFSWLPTSIPTRSIKKKKKMIHLTLAAKPTSTASKIQPLLPPLAVTIKLTSHRRLNLGPSYTQPPRTITAANHSKPLALPPNHQSLATFIVNRHRIHTPLQPHIENHSPSPPTLAIKRHESQLNSPQAAANSS